MIVAVDLKTGTGDVYRGEPKEGKPGCTITASEDIFVKMASGELNGQQVILMERCNDNGIPFVIQLSGVIKLKYINMYRSFLYRHFFREN